MNITEENFDHEQIKRTETEAQKAEQPVTKQENGQTKTGFFFSFIRSFEGCLFCAGVLMLILWLGSIIMLYYRGDEFWVKSLAMGVAHLLSGRAGSVAQAMNSEIPPGLTVFLAIYFDVMVMFVMYGILVFSYKHFLERRFFKKQMGRMFESAKKQMDSFRKFKIIGLFFFVWFPMWMTGVVIGSLLGFLMGLKPWVNMLTVIAGTSAAMFCWVFAFNKLFSQLSNIHKGIPLIITTLIVLGVVAGRFVSVYRERKHDKI